MRKMLIVANWKMNLLRTEAKKFSKSIVEMTKGLSERVDIVLAPAYTLLDVVGNVLQGTNIQLGAQDVFWEDSGAFTGEISPFMLKELGCKWVIIGHSERRNLFNETDTMVREKINASLKAEIIPILCVGETLDERSKGKTVKCVEGQLVSGLKDVELNHKSKLVIAYEPVWAIGTGKSATPEEIRYVHGVIRDITRGLIGEFAEQMRILYGGSVSTENCGDILSSENIDGALVGSASLKADSFAKMVQLAGG